MVHDAFAIVTPYGASAATRLAYDPTDADLVVACRASDRRAAALVFDRYAPLARRILARTLGPFHDLEDQVQETFVVVFRKLSSLERDGSLRAFIVSVAIRTARGALRRRRIRRVLHLAPPEELSEIMWGDAVREVEAREALKRLFAILDDLDATSRLAFTLRYFEEMELLEIACCLEESLATVKRRLARTMTIVEARVARDPSLSAFGLPTGATDDAS